MFHLTYMLLSEWRKYIFERHRWAKSIGGPSSDAELATCTSSAVGGSVLDGSALGELLFSVSLNPFAELRTGFSAEDRLSAERLTAVVPHMGAHLAELTSVSDGNADYLADAPHLRNLDKLRLVAATMTTLHKLQKMTYSLTPVRAVAAAINLTLRRHLQLSAGGGAALSKRLFALSVAKESEDLIAEHFKNSSSGALAAVAVVSPRSPTTDAQVTERRPDSVGRASLAKPKYHKSDAYESILRGTTAARSRSPPSSRRERQPPPAVSINNRSRSVNFTRPAPSSCSENSSAEEEGDDDVQSGSAARPDSKAAAGPRRLLKKASRLLRTMSFANRG